MRAEYDFSNAVKNPYVKPRKTAVTIRLDPATVEYFKSLASEVSLPYQFVFDRLRQTQGKTEYQMELMDFRLPS